MNQAAYILRENTGTSGLVESARVTIDVDIIVPDVIKAVEWLTASLTGPFFRVPETPDRVEDRRNGVSIDLLPAGKVLKPGCKVPFPQPVKIAKEFQIVSLEELLALKLDSWAGSPLRRLKDKADVVELITRRKLPRELAINPAGRALYTETWEALHNEKIIYDSGLRFFTNPINS